MSRINRINRIGVKLIKYGFITFDTREEMKLKGVKYKCVFEGYRVIQEQTVDDL